MSQQINLFNPIFLQQKKIFAARTMAMALGMVALGALAIAATASYSVNHLRREAAAITLQAAKKQARLASAITEFAPRKASAGLVTELGDAETQLAALRHVTQMLQHGDLGNTRGHAGYFRALARQHQEGLWLTGVSIGAGADMSLRGRALDAAMVPAYIARLTHEAVLQGKTFGDLQITQPAPPAAGAAVAAPLPFIEFALQAKAAGTTP